MGVVSGSSARPSEVRALRSSRKVVTSSSATSAGSVASTPARCNSRVVSCCTSAISCSKRSMGGTVSKLKRRLSAALISFTPRSRVFAVAMTLKPWAAYSVRPSPFSSGTIIIDRKSTRLNSSHLGISYAVFCLKKKKRAADEVGIDPHAHGIPDDDHRSIFHRLLTPLATGDCTAAHQNHSSAIVVAQYGRIAYH